MDRRTTIKLLAAGGATVALGGGYHWLTKERDHSKLGLDITLNRISTLELDSIETTGAWEVARTFDHLAQSIEFSMVGFPVQKSSLFQNTAGKLAFSIFQANGRMTHGLDEEIPGEVVETANADPARARTRLLDSLERFESFSGELMPHFAYGNLNKDQYAVAHVLHVNNHLEEFKIA